MNAVSFLHLDDARLLALAAGEDGSAEERGHLAVCTACSADLVAFQTVRAAAKADVVSPFQAARAQRDLLRALDDDQRHQRRAWRPRAVGALALSSAFVGALAAFAWIPRAADEASAPVVAHAPSVVHAVPASLPVVAPVAEMSAPVEQQPAPALFPIQLAKKAAPRARVPSVHEQADALVARGDGAGAARLLVAALERGETVEPDLTLILRRFPEALGVVGDDLVRIGTHDSLSLRCAQGLLSKRDRSTVDACRTFARTFPEDPAVRTLALAAGRVAEDDLGDLQVAEEEYERALLLSPFSGLPSTDALFARARVRTKLGELDEARADLRLYLHQEPAARHETEVAALMQTLGVP